MAEASHTTGRRQATRFVENVGPGLEAERARIVATLRLVADRLEKMPIHGIPEPLTFVRSVADALDAWSIRETERVAKSEAVSKS